MKKRNLKIIIDGKQKNVYAYRKNNSTIVKDSNTKKTITITKRYNTRNIEQLFLESKKKDIIIKRGDKDIIFRTPQNKPREIERIILPGKKTYFIERGTPLKKSVGQVFISVTFIKGNQKYTAEGGSNSQRLLNIKEEREKAFDEAYKGALSQCPFSPDKAIVNWVHYAYYKKI